MNERLSVTKRTATFNRNREFVRSVRERADSSPYPGGVIYFRTDRTPKTSAQKKLARTAETVRANVLSNCGVGLERDLRPDAHDPRRDDASRHHEVAAAHVVAVVALDRVDVEQIEDVEHPLDPIPAARKRERLLEAEVEQL